MIPELVTVHTSLLTDLGDAIRARFGVGGKKTLAELKEIVLPSVPSEYQQVDYIQSSGTQWINTGIAGRNGIKVVQDFEYVGTTGFQNHGSLYYQKNYIFGIADGKFLAIFGRMSDWADFGTADTDRHIWILDLPQNKCSLDETEISVSPGTFTTQYNLYLFNCAWQGTPERGCAGKLYGCQIFADGTIFRAFVPCYRKSDNEIGLYDVIGQQFYTNAGSGSFTCYPAPPSN